MREPKAKEGKGERTMSYNQNSHNRDFVYCDGKNCVLR